MGEALGYVFAPDKLVYLFAGVLLGLCVGVFPGLGGIAGLSLVLPFVYELDGYGALALAIGLVAVIPTSDTFSSVLLGIPGSSASQATVLDGFPLAKRGQAARALSAAFASSLFGGIIGAVSLTLFILAARPIILEFKTPELLAISLLGLSMVAILSGRIPLKGVAAAALGLAVGTIGEGPADGAYRMSDYDTPYLSDGIKLVIVGLGIFAVPEIISLLRQDRAIAKDARLGAGWLQGVIDWWRNIYLSIRSAIIGVVVGVIPGLGGSVVDWIAYGQAVQTTRDKSKFGDGEIRGVIAPESSNNAKEGGGLVPTLLFGIPGSGSMAIFLVILGAVILDPGSGDQRQLQAGPMMLSDNLDITYSIVWSLALANVFGAGLCILLSTPIARLTTIPFALLAPFLFVIISFAAFQSNQSLGDLAALVAIGVVGIMMRRFDWSRPAFLIGFVLADPVETYAYQFYQQVDIQSRTRPDEVMGYVFSPIVIAILVLTLISVALGVKQGRKIYTEGQLGGAGKRAPMLFLLFVAAYLAATLFDAYTIAPFADVIISDGRRNPAVSDMLLPAFVSAAGLIACLLLLIRMLIAPATDPIFADREATGEDGRAPRGLWETLAWLVGLLVLTALVGFIIALGLFLIAYFAIRARKSWPLVAVYSAAGLALMLFMGDMLNRDYPPGLLQELVRLPWPFR